MARLVDPNEKAPPGPEVSQAVEHETVKPETAPPDVSRNRTPFDVIMERFDRIDARMDQQGTAIVNIAEKVFGPQGQPVGSGQGAIIGTGGGGAPSWLGDLFSLMKNSVGGEDPMKEYFAGIGKTVFDKTMESTMKRVAGSLAGESARHVVG